MEPPARSSRVAANAGGSWFVDPPWGGHRGRRHAARAAGPGARGATGGRDAGDRDHRQCGQDDDEGNHRGDVGHALSRGEEQGEPEQPHRSAAVVDAAAHEARCGGDGTGHESRRGDQQTGRDRRTRCSCVDERRRRASRLLCVSRCHRRRQRRDPAARHRGNAAGLQRRRPARDGAGARVRGPDDNLRHRRERRRACHVDRGPRRGRHARACGDAGWRARLRDAAARTRQPGQRAGGHGRGARCGYPARLDRRRRRPASSRGSSRRGRAAGWRHHPHRRLLQLEPDGPAPRARRRRARDAVANERSRCSARCSSSATMRGRCTRSAAGPRRPPASRCSLPSAARRRARSRTRRSRPACRESRWRTSRRAPMRSRRCRRRCGAAIWCSSRDRAARARIWWRIVSRRSSPDAVLPAAAAGQHGAVSRRAERDSLHHVPHRGGEPDGVCDQHAVRPVADPDAARLSDRPDHPSGRTAVAPRQGRHADDGRAADSDRGGRADAAVGGSLEPVHLDRRAGDGRLRHGRVPRRLPEDHPPLAPRA